MRTSPLVLFSVLAASPLLASASAAHSAEDVSQQPPISHITARDGTRGGLLSLFFPKSRPDDPDPATPNPPLDPDDPSRSIRFDFDDADPATQTDSDPSGRISLGPDGRLTVASGPTPSVADPSGGIRFDTFTVEPAAPTTVDPVAPIQAKTQKDDANPSISASAVSTAASADATTKSSSLSEPTLIAGGGAASITPTVSVSSTSSSVVGSVPSSLVGGGTPFEGGAGKAVGGLGMGVLGAMVALILR